MQQQQEKKCPVCGQNMIANKEELYEKLGIEEENHEDEPLTAYDIKNYFKEAAKLHHPDRGGDPNSFNELREAKEQLLDMVDKDLLEGASTSPPPEEPPPPVMTKQQFIEVVKAVQRLRQSYNETGKKTCPYCKRSSKTSN